MSIIAVRKYEDRIEMSSDRQTSWGNKKLVDSKSSMYVEPSKMWQHNGFIIGSAGWVYQSTLFRIFTKTRKPTSPTVEGIIEYLVDFVDWAKKKDNDFKLENQFLIVFENIIFQTLGYEVQEISEYNAIGSGMFLALGAMFKGSDTKEAVSVAKEFDLFCSGDTDTLTIKLKKV